MKTPISVALLALALLTACAAPARPNQQNAENTGQVAAPAATTVAQNSGTSGQAAPALQATAVPTIAAFAPGIRAVGEVKAAQQAELSFATQGTVAQVLVSEGQMVRKGDLLAVLDTRSLDARVQQAEASLDSAKAQELALSEAPRAADVRAAQASVRQAEIALKQAEVNRDQNNVTADSSLESARINLQSQRDRLSQSKTNAQTQLEQSVQSLTKSQQAYATAKENWEYVERTGQNPSQPTTTDPTGKKVPNKLNDTQRQQYYDSFVQAEASLRQAENSVAQAEVDFEQARKAEITGVQSAEQQVAQAEASQQKTKLPAEFDSVAAARASLDAARANLQKLNPAPSDSDLARTRASVRQAEASLASAKVDRENAELRAPFDGMIAELNIDPGDPSSSTGSTPMVVIDISQLYVEVDISDVDIGNVTVGQSANVSADAVPNTLFAGTVEFIAPTASVSGNLRTFRVRLTLDTQGGLRPGMSVRVELPQNSSQ